MRRQLTNRKDRLLSKLNVFCDLKTDHLAKGTYFGSSLLATKSDMCSISVTDYSPNSHIQPHAHENSYLSVLIKGNYLEEGSNSTLNITPGDVLFRPGGYQHKNTFKEENSRCFNLELDSNFYEHYSLEIPKKFDVYKGGDFPFLYRLYLSFIQGANTISPEDCIISWLTEVEESKIKHISLSWITKTKKILDNEKGKFHSLIELSERVNVHPVYLSRAFKKKTGLTLSEYQLKSKLSSCISMLLTSKESISTISHANGFFDDAHFIRSFKSSYGISPNQFRKTVNS